MSRKKFNVADFFIEALRNYGLLIVTILMIVITCIIEPNFFSLKNFLNILRQISVVGIVACGMTYVIISGAFDLSVGSVISFFGASSPSLRSTAVSRNMLPCYTAYWPDWPWAYSTGVLISMINGRGGEAFIITYGTQIVVAALALFASKGLFISGNMTGTFYKSIGKNLTPIILMLVIVAVMEFILKKTSYGRKLSFIGGNIEAGEDEWYPGGRSPDLLLCNIRTAGWPRRHCADFSCYRLQTQREDRAMSWTRSRPWW